VAVPGDRTVAGYDTGEIHFADHRRAHLPLVIKASHKPVGRIDDTGDMQLKTDRMTPVTSPFPSFSIAVTNIEYGGGLQAFHG
jgi:hypothetical protein